MQRNMGDDSRCHRNVSVTSGVRSSDKRRQRPLTCRMRPLALCSSNPPMVSFTLILSNSSPLLMYS